MSLPADSADSSAIVVFDDVDAIPAPIRDQLTAIVARVFPDEPLLRGTFFFQSRPDYVVVATVGPPAARRVVGLRPVVVRDVDVGLADGAPHGGVRVMGGVIPTVDPDFRGQGHARRMTDVAIAEARRRGCTVALAFLFDSAPAAFLAPWGITEVPGTRFTSTHPDSGVVVVEEMRAFAGVVPGLTDPQAAAQAERALSALRRAGTVHLGVGTW